MNGCRGRSRVRARGARTGTDATGTASTADATVQQRSSRAAHRLLSCCLSCCSLRAAACKICSHHHLPLLLLLRVLEPPSSISSGAGAWRWPLWRSAFGLSRLLRQQHLPLHSRHQRRWRHWRQRPPRCLARTSASFRSPWLRPLAVRQSPRSPEAHLRPAQAAIVQSESAVSRSRSTAFAVTACSVKSLPL
jgi:hypothetical protein